MKDISGVSPVDCTLNSRRLCRCSTVAKRSRQSTILRSAGPTIAPSIQNGKDFPSWDRLGLEDSMQSGIGAMQAMAFKYLELARVASAPEEREKLQSYAALYREIAAQMNTPRETAIEQSLSSAAL